MPRAVVPSLCAVGGGDEPLHLIPAAVEKRAAQVALRERILDLWGSRKHSLREVGEQTSTTAEHVKNVIKAARRRNDPRAEALPLTGWARKAGGRKRGIPRPYDTTFALARKAACNAAPLAAFDPQRDDKRAKQRDVFRHVMRCKALPPIAEDEAARLVAEFLARKQPTVCPSAPSYGDGRNAGAGW